MRIAAVVEIVALCLWIFEFHCRVHGSHRYRFGSTGFSLKDLFMMQSSSQLSIRVHLKGCSFCWIQLFRFILFFDFTVLFRPQTLSTTISTGRLSSWTEIKRFWRWSTMRRTNWTVWPRNSARSTTTSRTRWTWPIRIRCRWSARVSADYDIFLVVCVWTTADPCDYWITDYWPPPLIAVLS